MKKLFIFVGCTLLLVIAVYAVFQSPIGQNWIQNQIKEAFKASGYKASVGKVDGALPNRIEIKDLKVQGKDFDLEIKELTLKPVLWRLFKKELAFKKIKAASVSLNGSSPFHFSGKAYLSQKQVYFNGTLNQIWTALRYFPKKKRANVSAQIGSLQIRARARLNSQLELEKANVWIRDSKLLSKLPYDVTGEVFAHLLITKEKEAYLAHLNWKLEKVEVEGRLKEPVSGKGILSYQDKTLQGELSGKDLTGSLNVKVLPHLLLDGKADFKIENLNRFFLPDLYGKLSASLNFYEKDEEQALTISPILSEASYKDLMFESLVGELTFEKNSPPFLDLTIHNGKFKSLNLEKAALKGRDLFELDAKGLFFRPFNLSASFSKNEVRSLEGIYNSLPFKMEKPTFFQFENDLVSISQTTFSIDGGSITFEMPNKEELHLVGKELPLDLFSENEALLGFLNVDLHIDKKRSHLEAFVDQIEPVRIQGKIEADLVKDTLNLKADLNQLLQLDLSLPFSFSLTPLKGEFLFAKQAKGFIDFKGNIGPILNYLDLKEHHLEGDLNIHLKLKNTLLSPNLTGTISLQNGLYENYYTGTELKEIEATLLAKGQKIYIESLTALDQDNDPFKMEGHITLDISKSFPFELNLDLNQFQFANIDLVQAKATGRLQAQGDLNSSFLKGEIETSDVIFTIPDFIPENLPDLEVTYRNPTKQIVEKENIAPPYPLYLDLSLNAPEVLIRGRGLNSSWKGTFDFKGTAISPKTKGSLDLLSGAFQFSSKNFSLKEGSLFFSGKPNQMPHLNLSGETEVKGISITAILNGPLDAPQISLRSNPPLPAGSILSYLLFDQDISEVGSLQAVQIAASLASLSGNGANLLEATRKSLGVDRFRIITTPSEDGGETISFEVGKYIAKGVLVSITQEAEDSSPDITVEIELKNNFVFQIQSDQRQEQGKFTLKWNLNY